ncbi:hypothetical protein LCGC14_0672940 [marine sediment metagenome]|uniref:Uncharacterized protein n=1 Tax=marine sediment metagenome TaxID=412755 RepID=A0A0F9QVK0_9ZZZZ
MRFSEGQRVRLIGAAERTRLQLVVREDLGKPHMVKCYNPISKKEGLYVRSSLRIVKT